MTTAASAETNETGILIGELAASVGVSAKTIRFYETEGILPPAHRDKAGHRRYGPTAINHVSRIRAFRSAGYSFDEIRELTDLRSAGPPIDELQPHLDRLDQQLKRLIRVRAALEAILDEANTAPVTPPSPANRKAPGLVAEP